MAFKKSLFGTSGIRGDAESLFTEQFCFDIGKTFIEFLKKRNFLGPIAVGIDPRDSSPRIKENLFKGLAKGGVELYDEGVTPIPSINWLIINTPITAGLMVTGSHIAPELNGVKFYCDQEEVTARNQEEIEKIYWEVKNSEKPPKTGPKVNLESRAKDLYTDLLLGLAKTPYPSFKVGLDCANGAQSVVVPSVLKTLGMNLIEVNCDPQKDFIARDTDTDDKAQLEELKNTVKRQRCDFGIAFDGDGDRVVFVDEKGTFVQGEYTCSIIAKEVSGDTIATPISSSQVVETLGKKVIRTKVGSPNLIEGMKQAKASFGFEANGGGVSAEIMYTRDGGSTLVKLLNIFAKFGQQSFSQMIATLPKFYMFRTKVDYKWVLRDKIIREAKERFRGIKIDETDGLKIWIDETTWMLFRSSANAPEFRVFAESKVESEAKSLLSEGVNFVNAIIEENKT